MFAAWLDFTFMKRNQEIINVGSILQNIIYMNTVRQKAQFGPMLRPTSQVNCVFGRQSLFITSLSNHVNAIMQ